MNTETPEESAGHERGSPLVTYAAILFRWRRVIFVFATSCLVATVLVTLLTRPVYRARASILPKQDAGDMGGLSSLIPQFGVLSATLGGVTASSDVFVTILESRYLAENVIRKLDLITFYKIRAKTPEKAMDRAVRRLSKSVKIGVTKRLSVFVEADATDRKMSAAIANAYLDELDRLNKEFSFTSARRTREFIGERLDQTREALVTAQNDLQHFQEENGMVALDEQGKVAVEAAAKLEAEILILEAQAEAQRKSTTGAFSRTRELERRIAALKNQLATLTTRPGRTAGEGSRAIISLARLPALGSKYAQLLLELKTQEAVFEQLTAQHEAAKIDEARDTPTIQILDRAVPPVGKHKPKRKLNLLIGLMVGIVGGAALAFLAEGTDRLLSGPGGEDLRWMWRTITHEIRPAGLPLRTASRSLRRPSPSPPDPAG